MNFQDNLLANAYRNRREASRKLFEHWHNKSTTNGNGTASPAGHWPMDGLNGHTIVGSSELHNNPANIQAAQQVGIGVNVNAHLGIPLEPMALFSSGGLDLPSKCINNLAVKHKKPLQLDCLCLPQFPSQQTEMN